MNNVANQWLMHNAVHFAHSRSWPQKQKKKMLETSAVSSSHGVNMKKKGFFSVQTMKSAYSLEAHLEMKDCY